MHFYLQLKWDHCKLGFHDNAAQGSKIYIDMDSISMNAIFLKSTVQNIFHQLGHFESCLKLQGKYF